MRAGEVETQAGVHHAHRGRVIAVAVMAFGEDRHAVDMGILERLAELAASKREPMPGIRPSVKVEMNLAEAHDASGRVGGEAGDLQPLPLWAYFSLA